VKYHEFFLIFINLFLSSFVYSQIDTISVVKHSESSHIINKNSKVLYQGIANPINISVPNAKSFFASGIGLTKISDGNYTISPTFGFESILTVEIVLKNDKKLTERHKFIIKNNNGFTFYFNEIKVSGILKRTKEQLKNIVISCRSENSNLDFILILKEFSFKILEKETIRVFGNKINNDMYLRILKIKKGSIILISDFKTTNNYTFSCIPLPPILIEITD
jgi:hypothetical protein